MDMIKKVLEGIVRLNIHGDWSDVDKGVWIGNEHMGIEGWSVFSDLEGKNVRVTIEELPPTEDN